MTLYSCTFVVCKENFDTSTRRGVGLFQGQVWKTNIYKLIKTKSLLYTKRTLELDFMSIKHMLLA